MLTAARAAVIYFTFVLVFYVMVGCGALAGTPAEHIAKLDARFHSMLTMLNVHENSLARLGELGVVSSGNLTTLADDRKDLRDFLAEALNLKKANGYDHVLEAGKIVMAWEQACKRTDVENKRDAERLASNLPPQLSGEDVLLLKKQFEANYNKGRKITNAQTPSKAYLELKVGHCETLWEAEQLTEVTSWAQALKHRSKNLHERHFAPDELGDTVSFKIVTKPFGIPMPADSEALRARLKLMGYTMLFLKLKFPQKGVLATCTKDVFEEYTEYLFGDDVWNFTSKGEGGVPTACPHQGIVEAYDLALREKVASLMSEGVDIAKAYDDAMKDVGLRNTAFLANFTTEVGSARCRALTAPAFREINGSVAAPKQGVKRKAGVLAIEDGSVEGAVTKTRSQRRKESKAKAKAKAQAAAQAAGKGARKTQNPTGGGAAGAKPAGAKVSGKAALHQKTADNTPICFAFNNDQACKKNPCLMAHVCQICLAADHPKSRCPNKPA